jgi:hypothetical protein
MADKTDEADKTSGIIRALVRLILLVRKTPTPLSPRRVFLRQRLQAATARSPHASSPTLTSSVSASRSRQTAHLQSKTWRHRVSDLDRRRLNSSQSSASTPTKSADGWKKAGQYEREGRRNKFHWTPQSPSLGTARRLERNVIVFEGEGGVQDGRTRRTGRTR